MAKNILCQVIDCGKPRHGRGFCLTHYNRWWRLGDPLAQTKNQAPSGGPFLWIKANVNFSGDECLIWPFGRTTDGYPCKITFSFLEKMLAHRLMCQLAHGKPPAPDLHAAHSCGNGHLACINPKHLRWATRKENEQDKILHRTYRGRKQVLTSIRINLTVSA